MARSVRIAAAGDIHCGPENADRVAAAFARIDGTVDLILLAGDLTTHGEPEQAALFGDICRPLTTPVYAVLGNHDWHADRCSEVADAVEAAGVTVLQRSWAIHELDGTSVGIVGTKGFVGGFPDSELPDFGEPSLRRVYAETTAEVEAIAQGLQAVADCDYRIVLLHYSPTSTTLEGEPRTIWAFLGTDRMAPPIADHEPDVVLHGHGHVGSFEGFIADVRVFNVAVPVMRRDFFVFELDGSALRPVADPEPRAAERAT